MNSGGVKRLFGIALCGKVLCIKWLLLASTPTSLGARRCFSPELCLSKSSDSEFLNSTAAVQKPFFSQKQEIISQATSSNFNPFGNQGEVGSKYCSLCEN